MKKHIIFSGHVGRLEDKLPDNKIPLCPHNSYCHKRISLGHNCFAAQEAKECGQVKRFYDKYEEAGNQIGVGT